MRRFTRRTGFARFEITELTGTSVVEIIHDQPGDSPTPTESRRTFEVKDAERYVSEWLMPHGYVLEAEVPDTRDPLEVAHLILDRLHAEATRGKSARVVGTKLVRESVAGLRAALGMIERDRRPRVSAEREAELERAKALETATDEITARVILEEIADVLGYAEGDLVVGTEPPSSGSMILELASGERWRLEVRPV